MSGSFSKRTMGIVIGVVFLFSFVLLPAYADEYDDYKNHSDKAEQYGDKKQKAQKDQNDYNKQIKDLDPQINQKQADLNNLENQLAQSENELSAAEKEYNEKGQILKSRIRSMYQEGDVGYLEILLDSKNFTEMVNRFEFLTKIAAQDAKLVADVKADKLEIEKKRNQQKDTKDKIQKDKDSLASTKATKEQLMKKAQSDAQLYDKLEDEELAKAQEISNSLRARTGTSPYIGGRMSWPVPNNYYITSPFGPRIHPIFHTWRFHSGIDIGAPAGATVVAAQSGTIIFAQYGWNGGYGNFIVIDHGGGITTAYAHLSAIRVSEGQSVKRGQQIGNVGSTGNSTGPHLHFEVRINGNLDNPVNWVKG